MKASYQLNARVSEETRNQFESIVEYYREQLPMGKLSKSEVLEEIIKKHFDLMQKTKNQVR